MKQTAFPLATVAGNPWFELPEELYVPPEALRVLLESFEGPLDLLLYLIKKQNIDIMDIPILSITQQYLKYMDMMQTFSIELAGEYLLMAALLAEIKSRSLLPLPAQAEEEEEGDPRLELAQRLQAYEQIQQAAVRLQKELQWVGREILVPPPLSLPVIPKELPSVTSQDLKKALNRLIQTASFQAPHQISLESCSVPERMTSLLQQLRREDFSEWRTLLDPAEGKVGVVVTVMAVLELLKQDVIELVQSTVFGPIYLKVKGK